jgi:hypothetical protein
MGKQGNGLQELPCRLPVGDTADKLSALLLARPAAGVAQTGSLLYRRLLTCKAAKR